jgi:hypothetical protein
MREERREFFGREVDHGQRERGVIVTVSLLA